MSMDPRSRSELDRLLETLRDGELSAAEASYLESLLAGGAELRRYYIRAVALQVGLRRLSAGPPTMGTRCPTGKSLLDSVAPALPPAELARSRRSRHRQNRLPLCRHRR